LQVREVPVPVQHFVVPVQPFESASISVSLEPANPAAVESLLRSLPAWFGIEDAIVGDVAAAARLTTYLARDAESAPVGVVLLERHYPETAELYLMAVAPTHHRAGIGRALLRAIESDLTADGVTLLEVKTVGPSQPDLNYARTRLFYQATGFQPVEELRGLWGDTPCLIMIKTLIPGQR
jgi:GNAT superfamily N-acetyltransferase